MLLLGPTSLGCDLYFHKTAAFDSHPYKYNNKSTRIGIACVLKVSVLSLSTSMTKYHFEILFQLLSLGKETLLI